MRFIILTATACLALTGCNQAGDAPAATNDANAAAPAATPATMSLNETSWTFTRDGKDIQESIDANGNYIANSGTEHVDHGTYVAKDGKACFTSAMDEEGEVCWTAGSVEIGGSMETVSDKGEKLTVTRVEYKPLTM